MVSVWNMNRFSSSYHILTISNSLLILCLLFFNFYRHSNTTFEGCNVKNNRFRVALKSTEDLSAYHEHYIVW